MRRVLLVLAVTPTGVSQSGLQLLLCKGCLTGAWCAGLAHGSDISVIIVHPEPRVGIAMLPLPVNACEHQDGGTQLNSLLGGTPGNGAAAAVT